MENSNTKNCKVRINVIKEEKCLNGGNRRRLCKNDSCKSCLSKSCKSHWISDHWSNKNEKSPREVFRGTKVKYWLNCFECGHTFKSYPRDITNKRQRWCIYCAHQELCSDNNCNFCFKNSFASIEECKDLSKREVKNPRSFFKFSHVDVFLFECPICYHEYEKNPAGVSICTGCPYCCKTTKKICLDDYCFHCYNRTFISYYRAKNWSKLNIKSPREVVSGENEVYWFDCFDCGHTFRKKVNEVTSMGQWCSFCDHKDLCKDDKCEFCYNNSFASSDKAKFWDEENISSPRQVFEFSNSAMLNSTEVNFRIHFLREDSKLQY